MGILKQREPRRTVMVRARLRVDYNWCDATICNVSSRGLMAKTALPPARGEYIELRHGGTCIIGRVAWSQGQRFGIRTQDKIDLAALLAPAVAHPGKRGMERRQTKREQPILQRPRDIAAKAEASVRLARTLDWGAVALAVTVGAAIIAEVATTSLERPLHDVMTAMAGTASKAP